MYKFNRVVYKEVNGQLVACNANKVGTADEAWETNMAPWWEDRVRHLIATGKAKRVK